MAARAALSELAARIDAALPQTQCTRCGYPDCAAYAHAIADEGAPINLCPPGGAEGIARLASITGQAPLPLSAEHGTEGPRAVAWIDEAWCIGCTLCIKACPTDAIVGSNKQMHTVIEPYCTGCELCIPVCPVDCIQLDNVSGSATGWTAWSSPLALQARQRYQAHRERVPLTLVEESDDDLPAPEGVQQEAASGAAARQAVIAAALERARQRRAEGPR
ncbi:MULTISPECIES: RnfABCDGE type electron transport complex subunit B [unclassified Acidovorax]|jgi:electron transport complex protein RnfB|uniref:RnfABCDGE type electron transport complex subunit B n=1 Tax=unclassified Acidovorax TaxID=2684926 RepID=UPI00023FD212|nr:RnfABCDGE type electron transport complex subunit B [Acidovorax sp. NO-1]EHL23410.1 RnfABCDGE type electron transport complex subunit B [Acidovorax sp. NO-1]